MAALHRLVTKAMSASLYSLVRLDDSIEMKVGEMKVAAQAQRFWTEHGPSDNMPVYPAHEPARESETGTE